MGIFIPNQLLERILAETDIVEVVSSYFPLKKSGRNFKALCPFHSEKTPSFMVSRDKQIFKCFGCGKGGNAFHFLMLKENMTFQEAVAFLARNAGIPLPERKSSAKEQQNREQMFALMSFAVAYYHDTLKKPAGQQALSYLQQRRVTKDTIEKFRLGFAPDAWDSFLNVAGTRFSPSLLERMGLIVARENSTGYYDRFRNRVMFPVFDPRGQAIGFSGRVLPGNEDAGDSPKYINSPESPLFNKGEVLYGLNFSRGNIAQQNRAIVCEGHMDLLAIDQGGIQNAVAAQGTSFTLTQARLLKRYCSEVIFAFDSDSAGQEATLRSFEPLMEAELDVRVAVLPPGYDPDLFVREKGAPEFATLIDEAVELVDFQLDVLCKKCDTTTLSGNRAVASQMLLAARKSPSPIVRETWTQKTSKALDIPEAALRAEMRRIRGGYRPFAPRSTQTDHRNEVRDNFAVIERERDIIGYMLSYEIARRQVAENLKAEDFSDPTCRGVAEKILSLHRQGEKVKAESLLKSAAHYNEAELITRFVLQPVKLDRPDEVTLEAIEMITRPRRALNFKELRNKIAHAEKEGGDVSALLAEYGALRKADDELRTKRY